MIRSGVHFSESLEVLEQTMQEPAAGLARDLNNRICRGERLGSALARSEYTLSDVVAPLVSVGERTGALTRVLDLAADWTAFSSQVRSKAMTALIYPAFVLVVNFLMAVGMLVYVLPQFAALYSDAPLPFLTSALIFVSQMLRSKLFWLVAVLLGIELSTFFTRPEKKERLMRILLEIPVVAPVVADSARAQYCAVLTITSRAGLKLLDSYRLAAEVSGHPVFRILYRSLEREVLDGGAPADHFVEHQSVYGPVLAQGMLLAEETGKAEEVMSHLTRFFKRETEYSVRQFQTLMEPFLLVVVSITTALILFAVYLPLGQFLQKLLP